MVNVRTKYKLFFRDNDPKKLPVYDTDEFYDLIDWEEEKCLGGINIDGVHISGWLYWHINHWHIDKDVIDKYGNKSQKVGNPDLRDNEWIIAEAIEKATKHPTGQKGVCIIGSRRLGKSEAVSSYVAYNSTMFENSQNIIMGSNAPDITTLKGKIKTGIDNIWEGLSRGTIDKSWNKDKESFRLGYKDTEGNDNEWSYIYTANTVGGKKTEIAAGKTIKSFIMDEVGKADMSEAFEAAKPAFMSEFGWRVTPIALGTGGSFTSGNDAKNLFLNPVANNFLPFKNNDGSETGLFISGLYRMDCKYETNLEDYLTSEKKIDPSKKYPNLAKIKIKVSNKDEAQKLIERERETVKNDPDKLKYLKQVMYFPLSPDECFLTTGNKRFNGKVLGDWKRRLEANHIEGQYVELEESSNGVTWKKSHKVPVSSFPTNSNEITDTPVVIYEHPMENPPYGLYTAGLDDYKFDDSDESQSLGSIYIYKRMHSLIGDVWAEKFVAHYVARPNNKEDFYKQARLLIQYYNARTLVENDDIGFIDYMKNCKKAPIYLESQPPWLKDVIPNSKVNRQYGISRSSAKVRDFLDQELKNYTEEIIDNVVMENGSINSVLGVERILDPLLLEELIQFDGKINTDRRVAAELALRQANSMAPIYGKAGINKNQALYSKTSKPKNRLFSTNKRSVFSQKRPLFNK